VRRYGSIGRKETVAGDTRYSANGGYPSNVPDDCVPDCHCCEGLFSWIKRVMYALVHPDIAALGPKSFLHALAMIAMVATILGSLALILFDTSSSGYEPPSIPGPDKWPAPPPVKYPEPEDSRRGPLSNADPVNDLDMVGVERVGTALPVEKLWGNVKTPYPTHEFYENIILGDGTKPENVITVLPYIVSVQSDMVSAIEPFVTASESQVQQIFDEVMGMVSLSGKGMGFQRVVRSDKLSVTVGWVQSPSSVMQTTLVQGDPFISMQYFSAQPQILSPQLLNHFEVDGEKMKLPCKAGTRFTASKMKFGFIQHDALWHGYAFPPLDLECGGSGPLTLTASEDGYTGVIRLALANNCTHGTGMHCPGKKGIDSPDGYEDLLEQHSNILITGGSVGHEVQSKGVSTNIILQYHTMDLNEQFMDFDEEEEDKEEDKLVKDRKHRLSKVSDRFMNLMSESPRDQPTRKKNAKLKAEASEPERAESGEALLLILPHHRSALVDPPPPAYAELCVEKVMLGCMTPYSTETMVLNLELPTFLWEPPVSVPLKYEDAIRAAIKEDTEKFKMPVNYQTGAGDPYNAGKLLSRLARIVLIADQMGMDDNRNMALGQLANFTSLWLAGKTQNPLVYDKNWGGMVSCGCVYDDCGGKCKPHCDNGGPPVCPSLAEGSFAAGMDFGNGYYNDHHFHYGYILYAAAVVARYLPEWGKEYYDFILLLVRDVANPSHDDEFFPQYRHMDFYAGHSWAGGIFQPFLNGRNQESVSEATNCWYSIAVLGDALGDERIKDIGLSLYAMETHAAHEYWQLHRQDSPTLPNAFTKNGVSGILWSNLIQYQTWFGGTTWELNGIQMLPFTPASEFLLPQKWVDQQIGDFQASCTGQCVTDGWISLVCMAQAIVDQEGAWRCAQKLDDSVYSPYTAEGNGNSKTNLLHWIATRPIPDDDDDDEDDVLV